MVKWLLGIFLLGAGGVLAGCGAAPDAVGAAEEGIIGGTTDPDDPSVVLLFAHLPGHNEGALCTASVITPHTLLTAAHCVAPAAVGAGRVFEAFAGTHFDNTAVHLPAIKSVTFDSKFDVNHIDKGHDVALAILSKATDLKPLHYNHLPIDEAVGKGVVVVGYGVNEHDGTGAGTKRHAKIKIDEVSELLFRAGTSDKQTCHGDSGGPAFLNVNGTVTIVGITSFGFDHSKTDVCYDGAFDLRVDKVAAWINANKK